MAEVIWTELALSDLDTIADYIALDNLEAARRKIWQAKPSEEEGAFAAPSAF